jgi:hypothetical protein
MVYRPRAAIAELGVTSFTLLGVVSLLAFGPKKPSRFEEP